MRLTTWGARGSIPVSGPQYQKYGGDTTCVELETDSGETLILDAGNGIRALGDKHLRLPGTGRTFHLQQVVSVRNVSDDADAMAELQQLTTKQQAPALQIGSETLTESADIIQRLASDTTGL